MGDRFHVQRIHDGGEPAPGLKAAGLHKRFYSKNVGNVTALNDVSFAAAPGAITALVGPDGSGKTTLLRLAAGLMAADEGEMTVLGIDAATGSQAIQNRISYMPQKFGLYEDLTVEENLDLYADLHGVAAGARPARYRRLMEMTDLSRFTRRLAGELSGGMKQKLGLACTLVRLPELLLLDEPTVGVDPLSRQELWAIIDGLVVDQRLTVLISTSYLDEAERCAHVVVLHEGRILTQGPPDDIRHRAQGLCFMAVPANGEPARQLQGRLLEDAQTVDAVPCGGEVRFVRRSDAVEQGDVGVQALLKGALFRTVPPSLEDGFMLLLRSRVNRDFAAAATLKLSHARVGDASDTVIEVENLVRKFQDFTAVDHATFSVKHGEIFGLLGPNGAGKTTTFRMLCGLLPATSGSILVGGVNLRTASAKARLGIGYVSQKFALYGNLTVEENLAFFGGAYNLYGKFLRDRIKTVMAQFELSGQGKKRAGELPGGFKQRLAMAAALLHEPAILFLDEPTSGADPLARREFWRRISALAEQGTTIVITTHFLEEAAYCDRIVIQDAGTVLALGTPLSLRRQAGETDEHPLSMEQAFLRIVQKARKTRHAEPNAAA